VENIHVLQKSAAGTGIVGDLKGLATRGNNKVFHSRRAEPTRQNTEDNEAGS